MPTLLANVAATWFLVGLIWMVQVVHYAQFDGVGADGWASYHTRHTRNITLIVGPAMLVELVSAIALIWLAPKGVPVWMIWAGLGGVAVLWLSTALVQVPMHNTLATGFDAAIGRRLVLTNWLRTAVWTGRGVLVLWMLKCAFDNVRA
ncbi:MAG: hypothetical protein AAGD32_03400 [Planctomycetota bacterium]